MRYYRSPIKAAFKSELLIAQGGCCFYCGIPFGAYCERNSGLYLLLPTFDHMVPVSFSEFIAGDLIVAACGICNSIKSNKIFKYVEEAQSYVLARWAKLGYKMSRIITPEWEVLSPLLLSLNSQPGNVAERFRIQQRCNDCPITVLPLMDELLYPLKYIGSTSASRMELQTQVKGLTITSTWPSMNVADFDPNYQRTKRNRERWQASSTRGAR